MWEEDPKWQTATYRFLVWGVAITVLLGVCVSLWSGEWQDFRIVLLWIGIFSAAICIYAVLVWTIAHLVEVFWKLFRKFSHRH